MTEGRQSHTVARLDEIEAIPGPGTLMWRPVRAQLGIRAFGTNAYTAAEAGHDVVEKHRENPDLAHQELYFVARGAARFTIDDDEFDAPAGTYVFVPDPASLRHAVALEPDTAVLSFGGPATFDPSPWEWWFRAGAVRAQDPERARPSSTTGCAPIPRTPAALRAGLPGGAARRSGRRAGGARDRDRGRRPFARHAAGDEDLAALRDHPRFAALTSS